VCVGLDRHVGRHVVYNKIVKGLKAEQEESRYKRGNEEKGMGMNPRE
jgi:hypothetical protein